MDFPRLMKLRQLVVRNFGGGAALINLRGGASAIPRWGLMLTLLQVMAFVILVGVCLAGFAAAIACTFAVWFGDRR